MKFNLSEKIIDYKHQKLSFIWTKEVAEFIRLLKEIDCGYESCEICPLWIHKIDRLAGEKFSK